MTRTQAAELLDAFDRYLDVRERRLYHNYRGDRREFQRANLDAQAEREKLVERFVDVTVGRLPS